MRQSKTLKRCFLLLAGGWLAALVYFLVVTLPLKTLERELQDELNASVQRLANAGYGMNTREVTANIERIQADIDAFSGIGRERARTIHLSQELERMLDRPFQLLDFDHQKFLIIDRIRSLSREKEVVMFEEWEERFPLPGADQPYLLWAQLGVMDELIQTVIKAGVDQVKDVRLVPSGRETSEMNAHPGDLEISVQMRLTGEMEAIHSVIMMLPLSGEELQKLGLVLEVEPKSSFFINRFILKKNSPARPGEVSFDFVVSGFLDPNARI